MIAVLALASITFAVWLALRLVEKWHEAGAYVDEKVAESDLEQALAEAIALTRPESVGEEAERWLRDRAR